MRIKEWIWKNLKSYGNNEQKIEFLSDKGELILLKAPNGSGKCVEKNTLIELEINNLDINSNLISYLLETEKGRKILQYIKENNKLLYVKIRDFRKA